MRAPVERGLGRLDALPRREGPVAVPDGHEARAQVAGVLELLDDDLLRRFLQRRRVLVLDLDPGHGERAGHRRPPGLDADAEAELEEGVDVGRRQVRLEPELGEHGGGVEVADDLADPVGRRAVVEEVGAGEVDGAARRRAHRHRAGVGPEHAPLRRGGRRARGRHAHDLEAQVGEALDETGDVGRQRVAVERPAGGGVLVGAVVGERGDHAVGVVRVPGVEVAVERVVERHGGPPSSGWFRAGCSHTGEAPGTLAATVKGVP